jgi:septum formation protein
MLNEGKPVALASSSKETLHLIGKLNIKPTVWSNKLSLAPLKDEPPKQYVGRSSCAKALAALDTLDFGYAVGVDKVVALGRRILWKAFTDDEALACIKALSGRRHRVYTSVCLAFKDKGLTFKRFKVAMTVVKFKRLSSAEIEDYISCKEGIGHEGGYDFQGRAQAFIELVRGSASGAAGLPLLELNNLFLACNGRSL